MGVDKMSVKEKNLAYDISLFEERKYIDKKKDNILILPKKEVKINKKNKLRTMFVAIVAFSFSVAIMGAILFNQAQLAEYTDKTNQLSKQLEECKSENTQLQMKIKERFSPEEVENYATSNLYMKKTSPSQVEYFSLSSGDKAELTQSGRSTFIDKILAIVGIR